MRLVIRTLKLLLLQSNIYPHLNLFSFSGNFLISRIDALKISLHLKKLQSHFFVLTEYYLEQRGHCCGAGCRHCPYDAAEQRRAGREVITGAESKSCSDTNKANKTEQDTTQKTDRTETR